MHAEYPSDAYVDMLNTANLLAVHAQQFFQSADGCSGQDSMEMKSNNLSGPLPSSWSPQVEMLVQLVHCIVNTLYMLWLSKQVALRSMQHYSDVEALQRIWNMISICATSLVCGC